jgi:hypothetical protein
METYLTESCPLAKLTSWPSQHQCPREERLWVRWQALTGERVVSAELREKGICHHRQNTMASASVSIWYTVVDSKPTGGEKRWGSDCAGVC